MQNIYYPRATVSTLRRSRDPSAILDRLAFLCVGAALALLAVLFVTLSQPRPAPASFDLVGLRDGAAYTLDTGLTDDDCARALSLGPDMRFDNVRCERAA